VKKPAKLFLLALLLAPIAIVAHEIAHWLVAQNLGLVPQLHFGSVSGIPEASPFGGTPLAVAAAMLAGPLATAGITAFGIWTYTRTGAPWSLALAMAAPTRFVANVLFLIQYSFVVAGIAERSTPNFDEVSAARALGIAEIGLAGVGAALFVLVWCWLLFKVKPGAASVTALLIGNIGGTALWLTTLGPLVFP
jgi:hypothetical protein